MSNPIVTADSRRRITLGNLEPNSFVEMEILENGQIHLTPVELIPKHLIQKGQMIEDGTPCRIIHEKS
jgi:hypothetical protein